ncbi:uncharacterized protein LOC117785192 [Drosophila innubila]|uniref:uncharacterized protein LOC117785192 n=1 Tax=Drosophila innubila TaxID=198719 RepID=UPI00148E8A9A|nr:uncharacterized protein LOC117785192 [Drosophila innubila]
MDINVKDLISEVYKRPVLWDRTSTKYRDRKQVEKNWSEIEETLETPKDCLKKKWKNTRDQFRNECKKMPGAKSGEYGNLEKHYKKYTSWPHFKSLLFLTSQMKSRSSLANIESSSSKFASELSLDEESLDEILFENVQELRDSEEKKIAKLNVSDELLAIEQQKEALIEKKVNTQKDRDDDEAFFDSLLPYMRKMEMMEKLRCRMEIQQIIYSFFVGKGSAPPHI